MLIIAIQSRFNIDQFLKWIHLFSWLISIIVFCIIGILWFFFPSVEEKNAMDHSIHDLRKETLKVKEYEKIGLGPLTLNGQYASPLAEALSREIVILAKNQRPDCINGKKEVLIGLRGTQEKKTIQSGTSMHLNIAMDEMGFLQKVAFAEQPTGYSVRILDLDKTQVLAELFQEGKKEEKISCDLSDSSEMSKKDFPFVQVLKRAKWWGQDKLFQEYGGSEFQKLHQKHKLELQDGTFSYVCYVHQNEYLSWDDGKWKNLIDQNLCATPLARVKMINGQQLEIETWDETGFYTSQIKLAPQKNSREPTRTEPFLSSIRLRTSSQVTCLCGKRRLILKRGDWILKTAPGWRHLKTLKEMEAYLAHELRGELFIFDDLEKEEGKIFLKGHLFDEMRTSSQPLVFPVSETKTHKNKKKKRKTVESSA